ncbi:MAG: hypothetical protein AB8Z23_01375 [Coxiella-like endosymbiont]|uniref:hypothetical protein n=1 Tax=Coxiella-like endosymbiont TaxID=1592897 RepID=UPI00215A5FD8|nr:hypothetical protein [Coxiella-like endosymbiont]UVE59651.1 hypothetical protein LG660_01185 [Coxiella-like endosymbiont]
MSEILRRLWEEIMPIIDVITFFILFIFGLCIFSYFLVVGAIIGLILFTITFIDLKIDKHKRPKESPTQQNYRI